MAEHNTQGLQSANTRKRGGMNMKKLQNTVLTIDHNRVSVSTLLIPQFPDSLHDFTEFRSEDSTRQDGPIGAILSKCLYSSNNKFSL